MKGKVFAASLVSAAMLTGVSATAQTERSGGATCPLDTLNVTNVLSYRTATPLGDRSVSRIGGAEIQIEPKRSVTLEGLKQTMSNNLVACGLDLDGVTVDAKRSTVGFYVVLSAPDEATAKLVVERARDFMPE